MERVLWKKIMTKSRLKKVFIDEVYVLIYPGKPKFDYFRDLNVNDFNGTKRLWKKVVTLF